MVLVYLYKSYEEQPFGAHKFHQLDIDLGIPLFHHITHELIERMMNANGAIEAMVATILMIMIMNE